MAINTGQDFKKKKNKPKIPINHLLGMFSKRSVQTDIARTEYNILQSFSNWICNI